MSDDHLVINFLGLKIWSIIARIGLNWGFLCFTFVLTSNNTCPLPLSHDHADTLEKNCQSFTLETLIEENEDNSHGEIEFLRAVVKQLCLLSESMPAISQRCSEINLTLDRGSLLGGVNRLRYGYTE